MKYQLIDANNLIIRYLPFIDDDEQDIETSCKILSKLVSINNDEHYDMSIIVSDSGNNNRANAIMSGEYKSNRNKARKESSGFIKSTKDFLKTVGFPYLSVENTEADMIISLLCYQLQKLDSNADITVYSNDSDFYQLLANDIKIYDWGKKCFITKDNWYEKNTYLKGVYTDAKYYSLQKAIVGDKSDNIDGVYNYGWKKVAKLFEYVKDKDIDNIEHLIELLKEEKLNENLSKKDLTFINQSVVALENNKDKIKRNFSVISFDALETPYIYKIITEIKRVLSEHTSFSEKDFNNFLHLDLYKGEEEYEMLKNRNRKNLIYIYNMVRRNNMAVNKLKELSNG